MSPVPIPDPRRGAQRCPTYRRIRGKQPDIWNGKGKSSRKPKSSKKHKKPKKDQKEKQDFIIQTPVQPIFRKTPKLAAYLMDAEDNYVCGCTFRLAHTLIKQLKKLIDAKSLWSRSQATEWLQAHKTASQE